MCYQIHLTRREYRSASYMDDRGYLGQIIEHCSSEDWQDDETVILRFTEPAAWAVQETIESDSIRWKHITEYLCNRYLAYRFAMIADTAILNIISRLPVAS